MITTKLMHVVALTSMSIMIQASAPHHPYELLDRKTTESVGKTARRLTDIMRMGAAMIETAATAVGKSSFEVIDTVILPIKAKKHPFTCKHLRKKNENPGLHSRRAMPKHQRQRYQPHNKPLFQPR